jgi:thiol-disulfide isomerase/thioredoxin
MLKGMLALLLEYSTTASHHGSCCADFFATWCNGCRRSYPELCKLAMDPDIQKNFKFVKVRGPAIHAAEQELAGENTRQRLHQHAAAQSASSTRSVS